jgi:hypothetical protein
MFNKAAIQKEVPERTYAYFHSMLQSIWGEQQELYIITPVIRSYAYSELCWFRLPISEIQNKFRTV